MRIIKFRGKDVKTLHWVYGAFHEHIDITPAAFYKDAESRENHIKEHTHYLIIQDAFSDYCMPRNIQCFDVTPETIGQFTGLHDKNGKEIYEGDIVTFDDTPYCVNGSGYQGTVVMHNGAWCVKHYEKYFDVDFYSPLFADDFANRKTIILGNIHDNPELLKGGEE